MLDKEGQQRAFNNFMELFVLPDIIRRKDAGRLPENFELKAAQVLFYSDGRKPTVRLNDETKIKFKNGVKKDKGEAVLRNEIEKLENLRLIDREEPEYAHISMVRFGDHWLFGFDFRYNKRQARNHLEIAQQFYKVAQFSYNNKLYAPFIDNLFSCVELLAHAELLLLPNFLKKRTSHNDIQIKYNRFVDMGNAKLKFKSTLNKLRGRRDSARYLKSSFKLSEEEREDYLNNAKEMLDYIKTRIKKL